MSVGSCLPGKFSDASQGPALQAGLSKDSRLRRTMLTPFGTKYKWHNTRAEQQIDRMDFKKWLSVYQKVIIDMTAYKYR